MQVFIHDIQSVPEQADSVLFSMVQPGNTPVLMTLKNVSAENHTINYRFQFSTDGGASWTNLPEVGEQVAQQGGNFWNTLTQGQVRSFAVSSTYNHLRVVGNASAGATLDFSLMRHYARGDGGAAPILSL